MPFFRCCWLILFPGSRSMKDDEAHAEASANLIDLTPSTATIPKSIEACQKHRLPGLSDESRRQNLSGLGRRRPYRRAVID
ncbi:hypothetical protein BKA70DRAFT_346400 [Coprinopsis sp. MPI-PUGE-AT-0042]|nr:hypothetical protein BKA70DRAFT_346400 [Coprinopsis sp. MPI-PUGE-AT-0042]